MKTLAWFLTLSTVLIADSFWNGQLFNQAHAETTSRAFPLSQQIMITVYKSRVSGSDEDARALFDGMNVPLRDSFLGPGKSIESADRGLSWVCGDKGANGVQCTLMMKATASTRVGYRPVSAHFQASSQEAQSLFKQLHPNTAEGHFSYQNEEGTLRITSDGARFEIVYEEP